LLENEKTDKVGQVGLKRFHPDFTARLWGYFDGSYTKHFFNNIKKQKKTLGSQNALEK